MFDPVQFMIRGDLKEMEVSYTHSFSCLVPFLTGQHVATHLFGSSMAKTGCRRCPLVSPSLFESSVVFGVLLLKSTPIGFSQVGGVELPEGGRINLCSMQNCVQTCFKISLI